MNREDLIKKWLDHDLNPTELEAFKKLEDYDSLIKLDQVLYGFKVDDFDKDKSLEQVLETINTKTNNSRKLFSLLSKIAAILVICFGIYFYNTTLDTITNTVVSQQKSLVLPDASEVRLNAMSTLSFNDYNWDENRNVTLDGEAFFKVAKGKTFKVNTNLGTITVLGTQFNVKQRNDYFEVTCFEGTVAVSTTTRKSTLLSGESFLIIDGNFITTEKEKLSHPTWLDHKSTFKSIPYKEVIAEFERQYDVDIKFNNIDDSQSFTGSFTHNDIEIALKSITLPLQLKYSKTDHIIRLERE